MAKHKARIRTKLAQIQKPNQSCYLLTLRRKFRFLPPGHRLLEYGDTRSPNSGGHQILRHRLWGPKYYLLLFYLLIRLNNLPKLEFLMVLFFP